MQFFCFLFLLFFFILLIYLLIRLQLHVPPPGLFFIIPCMDTIQVVDLRWGLTRVSQLIARYQRKGVRILKA